METVPIVSSFCTRPAMPTQPIDAKMRALTHAIDTVQPDMLRLLLVKICRANAAAVAIAAEELLVAVLEPAKKTLQHVQADKKRPHRVEENGSGRPEDEDDQRVAKRRKHEDSVEAAARKLETESALYVEFKSKFGACTNCEKFSEVSENRGDVCQWHPGTPEVDYSGDFWADADVRNSPRLSQLGDDYAEGFVWSCCEQTVDLPRFCKKGPHVGEPSVTQDASLIEAKWEKSATEHAAKVDKGEDEEEEEEQIGYTDSEES